MFEIQEKLPKLVEQLGHGITNSSTEKQILRELEHLHRRKELLNRQVKEAEAKILKPTKCGRRGWSSWHLGSKYELKRKIRVRF